jgi:DNA polymerase II large subunit
MSDERPEHIQAYYDTLQSEFETVQSIAAEARATGGDATEDIEIEFAADMAERCEKLLGIDGLTERVRELEAHDDISREESALKLAAEIAEGDLGEYDDLEGKVDAAVRVGVALLTEGTVAAPIEGIAAVTLESADAGGEFIKVRYAGPIRSAGGTGQALSVLAADYVRQILDIDPYVPRREEVERTIAEIKLYDSEVGLQYTPSEEDVRTIVSNLAVQLDADQATDREVGAYRDLERIEGNRARGGMCLTIAEGIAQKAAKLQKYTTGDLNIEGWEWLSDLDLGVDMDSDGDTDDAADGEEEAAGPDLSFSADPIIPDPSKKFIKDVIGGRPIIAYPSEPGAFRLRYGRSRTAGLAASGISPASMVIVNEFLATGTQMKTERPGKAQAATPVDGLEGPTVRLTDGRVFRIDTEDEAREHADDVEEVIDLGEMAVPFGEYLENNHPLSPASFVAEWWALEVERAGGDPTLIDEETVSAEQAFKLADTHDVPLHPVFTYLWHDLTTDEYHTLAHAVEAADTDDDGRLVIATEENRETINRSLEALLIPHTQHDTETVVDARHTPALVRCCDSSVEEEDALDCVRTATGVTVRERAPTRIGVRMGRPEKSKRREKPRLSGLVPLGGLGGKQRLLNEASEEAKARHNEFHDRAKQAERKRRNYLTNEDMDVGDVVENVNYRRDPETGDVTWRLINPETGNRTVQRRWCRNCSVDAGTEEKCPSCGEETQLWSRRAFDISDAFDDALERLGERRSAVGNIKGVKGLESETKIVEPLEKAILRAKYDLNCYSDGTARYDLSDLPLTAFRPEEIGTDVETLRDLGYETALDGADLQKDDQMVELKVQDVVVHHEAGEYLLRISKFIDDLLEKYYGLDRYYNAESIDDLIGTLMLGLAPHTSAGVLCRLIGYTDASAGYAHPFFHAAKRRNCFHPETRITTAEKSPDGRGMRISALGDFVERRFETAASIHTDDVGTEYVELATGERTGFDIWSVKEDGTPVARPITHVSRRPAPDALVELTVTGTHERRRIRVTQDHPVYVADDTGGLVEKPAGEVTTDDCCALQDDRFYDVLVEDTPEAERSVELASVTATELVDADCEYVYNLTVEDTHSLFANQIAVKQCDGDEDCFMLLMDGLINYSEQYLNHNRTGWSMDKPIVVTTELDPREIDDEAHNVDVGQRYPLELYAASREAGSAKEMAEHIPVAEDFIDDDFTGFRHSIESTSIDAGPLVSSYTTVGNMDEKLKSQLDIAHRTRAVDESDLAERVIDGHFLPDIRGNLRAFAQQKVQCDNCSITFRRVPLSGDCRQCGNAVRLTVYEGMVDKYVDRALGLADEYDANDYIRQCIEVIDAELEHLFNDQTMKQTGIEDFM